MMKTITFFHTREELRKLTGLPEDDHDKALWDVGFNLDDWDWGFVCDEEFTEDWSDKHPEYEYWMLTRMDHTCVGYEHVEYGGRHYYMQYHS